MKSLFQIKYYLINQNLKLSYSSIESNAHSLKSIDYKSDFLFYFNKLESVGQGNIAQDFHYQAYDLKILSLG